MASETAYAKINLALHVRRRQDDGYHAIETLFAFADDGDKLTLVNGPGLQVTGPFAGALNAGDNLVTQAAEAYSGLTGNALAGFHLDKRLPVAAGIGGGSADAAAALRLLCARDRIALDDVRIRNLAARLGADVPACLLSRPMRGEGRGDQLTPQHGIPGGMALLLVNPLSPLATGPVFGRWDGLDRGPLAHGDPIAAARNGRNDLETPAIAILPVIGDILRLLMQSDGVVLARMSGSGATCFALFEDDAARNRAADALAAERPDWWLMRTRLR